MWRGAPAHRRCASRSSTHHWSPRGWRGRAGHHRRPGLSIGRRSRPPLHSAARLRNPARRTATAPRCRCPDAACAPAWRPRSPRAGRWVASGYPSRPPGAPPVRRQSAGHRNLRPRPPPPCPGRCRSAPEPLRGRSDCHPPGRLRSWLLARGLFDPVGADRSREAATSVRGCWPALGRAGGHGRRGPTGPVPSEYR